LVDEPWGREYGIPFDMRAPLTPDIAVQVLPAPFAADLTKASIMESTNQGIARQNRIILGGAKQFVFSRQTPPSKFIKENFGKSAPKNIDYRIVNGRLETSFVNYWLCAQSHRPISVMCVYLKHRQGDLMGFAVDSLVIKNKSSHPVKVRKIANALKPCLSYRLRIIN